MAEQAEKKFQVRQTGVGGGSRSGNQVLRRKVRQEFLGEKEQFINELPSNTDGKDGDLVLYENKKNFNVIEQLLKIRGQWINLTTGRPLKDSAKVRKWIQGKTG
tara:strand:+ start:5444 stop:5755 length:312 start_codon:yes stop_codon:yes gene_type:complete